MSLVSDASVGCTPKACLSGPLDVGHQSCQPPFEEAVTSQSRTTLLPDAPGPLSFRLQLTNGPGDCVHHTSPGQTEEGL